MIDRPAPEGMQNNRERAGMEQRIVDNFHRNMAWSGQRDSPLGLLLARNIIEKRADGFPGKTLRNVRQ